MARPRIRTLKPEFFQDEKVNAISRDARYLTIGLITRADDRGRQQHMEQAILGHVYPFGDVPVKHMQRWLAEIVKVGIAKAYEQGPFAYLWLPQFWRHQKINRPSESDLPPHPDDPLKDIPITEAIKVFRGESFTESVSEPLTPPRAGARSVPFPSNGKTTPEEQPELHASALAQTVGEACDILAAVKTWAIEPVAVENAASMYPTVDLLQAARLAVTWAADPSWDMRSAGATLRSALLKLNKESDAEPKAKRAKSDQSKYDRKLEVVEV